MGDKNFFRTFNVVGLDTGTRDSLGCSILSLAIRDTVINNLVKDNFFNKKGKLRSFSPKLIQSFMKSLFYQKEVIARLLYATVFNLSKTTRKEIMQNLLLLGKHNDVLAYGVEDFLYFSSLHKKNLLKILTRSLDLNVLKKVKKQDIASWYIVSKVQNLVGYITGYLEANNQIVFVFPPRSWKAQVKNVYLEYGDVLLNKYIKENNISFKKTHIDHIYSSIGVALACLGNYFGSVYAKHLFNNSANLVL